MAKPSRTYRAAAGMLFAWIFGLQLLNGLAIVPTQLRALLLVAVLCTSVLCGILLLRSEAVIGLPPLRGDLSLQWIQVPIAIIIGSLSILTAMYLHRLPVPAVFMFEAYLPWEQIRDWGAVHPVVFWLTLAIFPALVEESAYKSLLIRVLPADGKKWIFVCVSSATFALIHIEHGLWWMTLVTILYGIPTAVYYFEERTIGPLLVMHCAMNMLAGYGALIHS